MKITVDFDLCQSHGLCVEAAPELGAGDCPEMAQLETLEPGKRGTVTLARSVSICGFHEAAAPSNMAFKGLIVVH